MLSHAHMHAHIYSYRHVFILLSTRNHFIQGCISSATTFLSRLVALPKMVWLLLRWALAAALVAIGWNQVGCCSRASHPGQFCSAYSSGTNQSHDRCTDHCNLFDNNLSVTHCNILAKLHGDLIGVCQLPGRVPSVACGM